MKRSLKLAAVAATLALGLTACGSGGGDAEAELGTPENPVRIGTVSAGESYWETFKSAVEAEGISVELVNFTDYSQPNPALSEGEIHLN